MADKFEAKGKSDNANVATTIRFTEKLFDDLKKYSDEKDISFNYLVLQCCEYALKNRK